MGRSATTIVAILAAFIAGLFTHVLYRRWNPAPAGISAALSAGQNLPLSDFPGNQDHPVRFVPLSPTAVEGKTLDLPVLVARDVDKIRTLAGRQARVQGRVFRVGYSAKSNTYFLNFGPSREALTAVIFASSVELFEKNQQAPKLFENKEVEMTGEIKDHPQYGLEMVLDTPKQIKILYR
jgi:hypothetical protein